MKKVKIGFDFDKVFVNYPPLIPSAIIELLYKRKNGKLAYRMPGKIEQKIRTLSHHVLLRPPIIQNVNAMAKILEKGDIEAYVISSRFSFLKNKTNEWNKKYGMEKYFKKMFFNFKDAQPQVFKEEILRKEKIEKFIDDDLDLLRYLSERNPAIQFFWITNSKKTNNLPSNIRTIKNIDEFIRKYV